MVLAMPMNVHEPSSTNCAATNAMPTGRKSACGVSSWLITRSRLSTRTSGRSNAIAAGVATAGSAVDPAGPFPVRPASSSSRCRSAAASRTVRYASGASVLLPPTTSSRNSARPVSWASSGRRSSTAWSRSSGMARLRRHSSPSWIRSSRPTMW
jgi:hypothetical protein